MEENGFVDVNTGVDADANVNIMRKRVNHIFQWLLIYNFASLAVAFAIDYVLPGKDSALSSVVSTLLCTVLVYLCTFKKWPVKPFARGTKRMTWRDFATIFGLFGLTQIITLCVSLLTTSAGIEGTSLEMGEITPTLFIYAVICGPLVEELMYRGFAIGNGRPLGKIPAICIAAFAFGLMHGNLMQFVIGCLGGLVLGFVFAEYSIWWALLIHIINNGLGVSAMMISEEWATIMSLVSYAIYGVFAVYAIIQIIKRRDEVKAWFTDEENRGPEGVARSIATSPWFIAFTAIYVATIVLMMIFPDALSVMPPL